MGGIEDEGSPPLKRMKKLPLLKALPEDAAPPAFSPGSMDTSSLPSPTVGSKGLIRRVEFVRIITQSLYSLGYGKAASRLEEESGIHLQSDVVTLFTNQILEAKWDQSVDTLHKIGIADEGTLKSATFLILQHKFLEQLEKGNVLAALNTLRMEISPLQINRQRVHQLASCVISPSRCEVLGLANKEGVDINSRTKLVHELQQLLPPSIMIPERRLEHLIEQALHVQREACIFHNSLNGAMSLYTDHRCGRDQIPTVTLQVLQTHENEVWFLQFSNDGKYLASASKDFTAIIWKIAEDGAVSVRHTLRGHQKPVSFVAWSPDDKLLLTCGIEEVVKLWDVDSGECKLTYDKGSNGFTSCAWFPDARRFVSGGVDRCIYTLDLEGKELDLWKGQRMPKIYDLAVTSDGSQLISICGEKDIRIYTFDSKTERVIAEENPITSLSVSKDGRFLLVNLVSQEIHLWDIAANSKLPLKYKGHKQGRYVIRSCFGGPDHAFIASGSEDSQVYIWHRGNGELLEVLPGHSGTVNCVSWNPVNPHMFASASDDHTIRIWGLKGNSSSSRNASICNGSGYLANGGPKEAVGDSRRF
eukprot:Gb_17775 [translate_table: standard]